MQAPASRRPQVLLVEDDPAQSAMICKRLEKASFDVVTCDSVESGLKLNQQHPFAAAVVDLDLGGSSGFDFVRGISKTRSRTKVILHSVDLSFQSVKDGLNLGVFAYVEKGRSDNQLIDFCQAAVAAYLNENLDAAQKENAFQLRLLEAVDHGIIATDPYGKVVYWNHFSERITGLEQVAAIGQSIFDFLSLPDEVVVNVKHRLEHGGNWHGEGHLWGHATEPYFTQVPIRIAISELRDPRGETVGAVISFHDLSEVKSNEQRLKTRARLLSIHAELGRRAVEMSDRNMFLHFVLMKLDEAIHFHAGRILLKCMDGDSMETVASIRHMSEGQSPHALVGVDQMMLFAQAAGVRIPLVENDERIGSIEIEFANKKSMAPEERDFLESVSMLVDGFLARNWASHLWRSLFENSLDAVLIANDRGVLVDGNIKACEMLGYAREELLHLPLTALDLPNRTPVIINQFRKLLAEGRLNGEIEFARKDRSGVLVEYQAIANILPGIHIAHFRDITEKKHSERLISEQQDQLAHVQRTAAMGQMAAVLAHEINQPLGAISNYSGGLLYGMKQSTTAMSEISEKLENIYSESIKAGAIIHRLRKFISREPLQMQLMDLNSCIRDTLKLLMNLLANSSVEIRLDLEETLPPVMADSIQIQQVMMNVIKNSVEATLGVADEARWIELSTRSEPDCVVVSIRDNGPKLSDAEFAKLFQPYHSTKPNGLGMGLCISQSIVEQHGGTVEMVRQYPHGMRTTVCIPRSKSSGSGFR
jgi:PAS domain S-box-containing protein